MNKFAQAANSLLLSIVSNNCVLCDGQGMGKGVGQLLCLKILIIEFFSCKNLKIYDFVFYLII